MLHSSGNALRLSAVAINGKNLLLAGVEFDGVMVGSWLTAPAPSYDEARKTVVPLNQAGPANQDEVTARNASGSDTDTLSILPAGPAAPANIDVVVPGVVAYKTWYGLQEAVAVLVVGSGSYPGLATLVDLKAGPDARALPVLPGPPQPALGTKMRGEHLVEVFFPRTLPAGSYTVELKNDPVYAAPVAMETGPFVQN